MRSAIEETYEDVKLLLHSICHQFMSQKGIAHHYYDEWHAEALLCYVSAYRSFEPNYGRFTTWLWSCVWHGLNRKFCRDARHHKTAHPTLKDFRQIEGPGRLFKMGEFFSSLSEDARIVVRLVFGVSCRRWDEPRRMTRNEMRLLVICLLQDMGWTYDRIKTSFGEIRRALID